jgi:hypothetical protein
MSVHQIHAALLGRLLSAPTFVLVETPECCMIVDNFAIAALLKLSFLFRELFLAALLEMRCFKWTYFCWRPVLHPQRCWHSRGAADTASDGAQCFVTPSDAHLTHKYEVVCFSQDAQNKQCQN